MTDLARAEPVIVDLLRHGEVEGKVSIARGRGTDVPLTENGWGQMKAVTDVLVREGKLTAAASSPVPRCADFAAHFSEQNEISLQIVENMAEIDFGDWEGKSAEEIRDKELLSRFMENPDGVGIPGGESFNEFAQRIIDAWELWLADASGEHRLLIAHGLVIRILLAHLTGLPLSHVWRLVLPYGSWSRVTLLKGEQPRLLFMNRELSL